jgi:hypothetical protein
MYPLGAIVVMAIVAGVLAFYVVKNQSPHF